ncbi:MAG: hypothetical protein QNL04_01460 [SAR324 cluster bacterium]|nr:hypothetical protein [SAR324 cluster bacterium]
MDQLLTYSTLIPLALILAVLPVVPEPHLIEKVRMLSQGTLVKPIDIFDLFWHTWPMFLLGYKVVKDFVLT